MSSVVLCAGTVLITLHKLSHLILKTAVKENIFFASFTSEDPHAQRGLGKCVHGNYLMKEVGQECQPT